jgi:hypothetical protein
MAAPSDKPPPITSAVDPDLTVVRRFIEDMALSRRWWLRSSRCSSRCATSTWS